jgi:hypothetical protein
VSVHDAAQRSRLDALKATRDKLAEAIDEASSNVLAQLTKQFRDTLLEIEELAPTERKATGLSDFQRRLAERQSRAAGSGGAGVV